MEERVPPTHPDDHDHNHNHNHNTSSKEDQEEEFDDHYNINHDKNNVNSKDKEDDKMQVIPSKKEGHATYIIQIPKDQIYRVPPPENAEIVERYRNPVHNNQKGRRRRCMYWLLSIFFVVAFIVSVIVCVHHFTLKPKNPTFSIKHLAIKHPTKPSSKNNTNSPGFQVSLETMNPNNINDIGYQQGNATLAYKGKEIGHGSFPALENEESGKSDSVDVILSGLSKGSLPKELEPQPHNKNTKPLNLNLSMSIPLNMKTWLFNKVVDVKVGCDFEVNFLGDNIKVLSQKCDIRK
ncbi:NDR1/HIN1-like protein 13 [Bienertia sinuspersici]